MSVKLSVSVPDDVAAYLQSGGDVSAAVTEAVRRMMPEARRARQRAAARAYGEYLRDRPGAGRDLIEASNDVALGGPSW
jgi:hypothetical protein